MKKSEFLRAAVRECLAERSICVNRRTSKSEYLCHAVADLLEMKTIEPHEHAQAKEFVLDHLKSGRYRHSAYVSWLCSTDPEMAALRDSTREKDVHAFYIEVQRRKHEWVKQLIASAIEKGI